MTRWFWRVVHNVVAHPLMELVPPLGVPLHEWTADRAFGSR